MRLAASKRSFSTCQNVTKTVDVAATILTGRYREPQRRGRHIDWGRYRAGKPAGPRSVLAGTRVIITHMSHTVKQVTDECNIDLSESLRPSRYSAVASTSTVSG